MAPWALNRLFFTLVSVALAWVILRGLVLVLRVWRSATIRVAGTHGRDRM